MSNFTVYSKDDCPYCVNAKDLIKDRGFDYTEKKLGRDFTKEELQELIPSGRKLTVPQIWTASRYIGGYDDLLAYFIEETAGGFGDGAL